MKKSSVLTLTKGVVFSYLISGICLLILAFLLFQFELPEGVLRGGIIFSYVFSCFLGGMVVSGKQEGKKIFVGALSRNLVLCHFSCRFHDTEPGSIHKNPGRFPCIISLCIRWHVRRHDAGRQKVNLAELKCCLVSMQRKSV